MPEPFIPPEFLNPTQWFWDPRPGPPSTFLLVLGDLFLLLLLAALALYALAPRLVGGHRLRTELLRRLATALAIIGALGGLWGLARALGSPLMAKPLWLWLIVFALVGVVAYAIYYWRTRYPSELQAWDERERRRRWAPAPRKRAAVRRR
jgi:hypothetical protein